MPQKLLYHTQISSPYDKRRGKRVTQDMRRDAQVLLDDLIGRDPAEYITFVIKPKITA